MKTFKNALKNSIALFFLGGVLLVSCSDGTDESTSNNDPLESAGIGDVDTTLADIDTNQVLAWNTMRTNAESVQNCVGELTNHFSIVRPDETVDSIYVYIGYDADPDAEYPITLYPIASSADTMGNLKCLQYSHLVNGSMDTLPVSVARHTSREDAITLADAKTRIGRWIDDTTRNNWIAAVCNDRNGDKMGQIFVIKTVDMVPEDKHECYLALHEDSAAIGGYHGDLIIVNTRTHEILQPAPISQADMSGVIEDVVRLVPPFKPLEKANFGLLKMLGIK
jgi:hypothetical protein